jgi:hypothetical protein
MLGVEEEDSSRDESDIEVLDILWHGIHVY